MCSGDGEWNGGTIPRLRLESVGCGENKVDDDEDEARHEHERRKLLRKR